MAKINIVFNNTNYSIDESSLSVANAALKSHLSTVMNGSGASISFGGTSYNVDSTKLSTARNDLVSHLGKIAGSGSKVVVGGVEYNVDSDKINIAISELQTILGSLQSSSGSSSFVYDDTYPIEWDVFDLRDNENRTRFVTIDPSGQEGDYLHFAKISNLILVQEEAISKKLEVSVDGQSVTMEYAGGMTGEGFALYIFGDLSMGGTYIGSVYDIGDGSVFPETGTYAFYVTNAAQNLHYSLQ